MLISPQFLYRALELGELDAHDLSEPLGLFLDQRLPDETQLLAKARSGALLQPGELRKSRPSMLDGSHLAALMEHFGQWLDTRN